MSKLSVLLAGLQEDVSVFKKLKKKSTKCFYVRKKSNKTFHLKRKEFYAPLKKN